MSWKDGVEEEIHEAEVIVVAYAVRSLYSFSASPSELDVRVPAGNKVSDRGMGCFASQSAQCLFADPHALVRS